MKKIITVLFAVLAMSSMFAYIPNKKEVEKYGDCIIYGYKYKDIYGDKEKSYITYNTKTGEIYFSPYEDLKFLNKEYSVIALCIQNTERMWEVADEARENYRMFIEIAERYRNYEKKITSDKYSLKANLLLAKEIEKQFLDEYPFFTKENWLTLTKEEWNKMAKDFLENN